MTILCIFICINVLVVVTSTEFSPLTKHNLGDYYDNRFDIDLEEKDDFKMLYSDVDDTFDPNMLVRKAATADYSFDKDEEDNDFKVLYIDENEQNRLVKKEVNANNRFDIDLKEKHHSKMLYSDKDDTVDPNMLVRKETYGPTASIFCGI